MSDPCDPIGYKLSHCSVHGISLIRILTWVSFFRGSSWSRYQSCISCIAGDFLHRRQILYQWCHQGSIYIWNYCYSVTNGCLTLCDPMNCSMPGFLVLQYLTNFAQTHIRWISDGLFTYIYTCTYMCVYIF